MLRFPSGTPPVKTARVMLSCLLSARDHTSTITLFLPMEDLENDYSLHFVVAILELLFHNLVNIFLVFFLVCLGHCPVIASISHRDQYLELTLPDFHFS
ncbi:hypothetical protein M0804_011771 [Polistes exclamans]|nr:hypothetical protein M0804_011771 [Polistes exclamans]